MSITGITIYIGTITAIALTTAWPLLEQLS